MLRRRTRRRFSRATATVLEEWHGTGGWVRWWVMGGGRWSAYGHGGFLGPAAGWDGMVSGRKDVR